MAALATMLTAATLALAACAGASGGTDSTTTAPTGRASSTAAEPIGPKAGCAATTKKSSPLAACEGDLFAKLDRYLSGFQPKKATVLVSWNVAGDRVVVASYYNGKPIFSLSDTPRVYKFVRALNDNSDAEIPLQFGDPAWSGVQVTLTRAYISPATHYIMVDANRDRQLANRGGRIADDISLLGYTFRNPDLRATLTFTAGVAPWSGKLIKESAKSIPVTGATVADGMLGTEACQAQINVTNVAAITQIPNNDPNNVAKIGPIAQETWCNGSGLAWAAARAGYNYAQYRELFAKPDSGYVIIDGLPYLPVFSETSYLAAVRAAGL